jgi:putative ATPase
MIFWGPPGSGKTTLAHIIAQKTNAHFISMSAVTAKLEDIRNIFSQAKEVAKLYNKRTILFIDEIHRFNKAQQDAFLPHVESGTIILIGATTENPSFEVIGPLLSRSRVLVLEQLTLSDLKQITKRALKFLQKNITSDALKFLIEQANGDSRILLNTLEIANQISTQKEIDLSTIEKSFQRKHLLYDVAGDEHYNTISAFIKSMRASQVDSALYYLARMVAAGEDPLFIARRMVVFASEDVASPTALVVANSVFRACETIGYPECQENLAAGVVYLSQAKKDRSAYDAYMQALEDVKKYGNLPIPLKVRNAPTKLMKNLGYGSGYEIYTDESFLPEKLKHKKYFIKK